MASDKQEHLIVLEVAGLRWLQQGSRPTVSTGQQLQGIAEAKCSFYEWHVWKEQNHSAINDKCQLNTAGMGSGVGGWQGDRERKTARSSMQSARDITGHLDMSLYIPRLKGTKNISYSLPVGWVLFLQAYLEIWNKAWTSVEKAPACLYGVGKPHSEKP